MLGKGKRGFLVLLILRGDGIVPGSYGWFIKCDGGGKETEWAEQEVGGGKCNDAMLLRMVFSPLACLPCSE